MTSFEKFIFFIIKGNLPKVQTILKDNPAYLEQMDKYSQTALLHAAAFGHVNIVKYLHDQGARLDIYTVYLDDEDVNERSPLVWAIMNKHEATALFLLGVNADKKSLKSGLAHQRDLFHLAAMNGLCEVMRVLLKRDKSRLEKKDAYSHTALFYAAASGHIKAVEYLHQQGATFNVYGGDPGRSFIEWTMYYGNEEIIIKIFNIRSHELGLKKHRTQFHLLEIAIQQGLLNVVKKLLQLNPKLRHTRDIHGYTMVHWAARENQVAILEYFHEQNISLTLPVEVIFSKDYGKTPLLVAIENKSQQVVSFIIHCTCSEEEKVNAFNFIKTATEVLEYLGADSRNRPIFMKNLLFKQWVNESPDLSENEFLHYRPRDETKRRPSICFEVTKSTFTVSAFEPEKTIGAGTYGNVMSFINAKKQRLSVKYPKKLWKDYENESEIKSKENEMMKATTLFDKAYPNNRHQFFCFKRNINIEGKEVKQYSTRKIAPYVKGQTLYETFETINTVKKAGELIMSVTAEQMRLHEENIIHGDVKENNIVVSRIKTPKMTFIDFDFAYSLTDNSASTFPTIKYYIAPERKSNDDNLKPDVAQDIHSFGWMLKDLLKDHGIQDEIEQAFPSIQKFIKKAVDKDPKNRPALKSFFEELNAEYMNVSKGRGLLNVSCPFL